MGRSITLTIRGASRVFESERAAHAEINALDRVCKDSNLAQAVAYFELGEMLTAMAEAINADGGASTTRSVAIDAGVNAQRANRAVKWYALFRGDDGAFCKNKWQDSARRAGQAERDGVIGTISRDKHGEPSVTSVMVTEGIRSNPRASRVDSGDRPLASLDDEIGDALAACGIETDQPADMDDPARSASHHEAGRTDAPRAASERHAEPQRSGPLTREQLVLEFDLAEDRRRLSDALMDAEQRLERGEITAETAERVHRLTRSALAGIEQEMGTDTAKEGAA